MSIGEHFALQTERHLPRLQIPKLEITLGSSRRRSASENTIGHPRQEMFKSPPPRLLLDYEVAFSHTNWPYLAQNHHRTMTATLLFCKHDSRVGGGVADVIRASSHTPVRDLICQPTTEYSYGSGCSPFLVVVPELRTREKYGQNKQELCDA
jgi:hypothetical protein